MATQMDLPAWTWLVVAMWALIAIDIAFAGVHRQVPIYRIVLVEGFAVIPLLGSKHPRLSRLTPMFGYILAMELLRLGRP